MKKSWGEFLEETDSKKGTKSKPKNKKNQTFNPSTKVWDDKEYGGIGLHDVFRCIMPVPIFIKAMPTEEETNTLVNEILAINASEYFSQKEKKELDEAQQKIQELQNKMYSPTRITEYENQVNNHFNKLFEDISIKLDAKDKLKYTVNSLGKTFDVRFNNKNSLGEIRNDIPNQYDKVGHGAIRTAIFTLLLMRDIAEGKSRVTLRKSYIVLFEEPELFLHPKLVKVLKNLVYEVSNDKYPYQLICASHSPQMIDLTKPKSSLVRMIKLANKTQIFQIDESFFIDPVDKSKVKEALYEAIRFNPFICESFYADEVILVEGDTETIILRSYLSEIDTSNRDIFVVNCATVNNIPFFQEIFSKFNIRYSVICDTDNGRKTKNNGQLTTFNNKFDSSGNPILTAGIQKNIYSLFIRDQKLGLGRYLFVNDTNFEDAHRKITQVKYQYRYSDTEIASEGKPYCANEYWKTVIKPSITNKDIAEIPIISYLHKIINI